MPEFISDTLTHWTGRDKTDKQAYKILQEIISTKKLLLTYCPNYPNLPIESQLKTMMVCFTDIPLKLSEEHCKRFGKFGIGFSKDRMIKYGANPVLYTTQRFDKILEDFISLKYKLQSEEIDRNWKEANLNEDVGDRYQYTSDQFYSLSEIAGFTQNYKYSDSSIDYYQREWRINAESLPTAFGSSPQSEAGQSSIHGNIGTSEKPKFAKSILFELTDIDYLIVPIKFKKLARKICEDIGCNLKIYEVDVERKWWRRFL